MTSEGDYDRSATMGMLRADGHFKFNDHGFSLDFGIRQGNRTADNENFSLIAPVYPGLAYYNPVIDPVTGQEDLYTRIPVPGGCYQHYKAADIVLDGQGIPGACKAGDPTTGFYRANPLVGLNPYQLGTMVTNNTRLYQHLAGCRASVSTPWIRKSWTMCWRFRTPCTPGRSVTMTRPAPGEWTSARHRLPAGQLQGTGIVPFGGNVGVKFIKTTLNIDQHSVSPDPVAYYVNPHDGGIVKTDRNFTDTLPVANIYFDLRNNLRLRLAYSKNMQLLDLDQWGGGLTLDYAYTAGPPAVFAVYGGQQAGNPDLDPWRSTQLRHVTGVLHQPLEHGQHRGVLRRRGELYRPAGHRHAAICPIRTAWCVRCVGISGPSQGTGKSLHGLEFGLKQAFDFLPGISRNLGIDANFTYSPSDIGKDIAGNTIPFQENSKEQANLILWYQDKKLEVRVAGNYRSKRAVAQDYGGITGFEEYQDSTFYLDASTSYQFAPHWTGVRRRLQPHQGIGALLPGLAGHEAEHDAVRAALRARRARAVLRGQAPLFRGGVAAGLDGHRRCVGVVQVRGRERSAPGAAGVEAEHAVAAIEAQRRPVAKDDAHRGAGALLDLVPGHPGRAAVLGRSFLAQVHAALRRAHAHPGEHVDDEAQPIFAGQRLVPAIRLVAVHHRQQPARIAAQRAFDLACQLRRLLRVPLRHQPGMHQQVWRALS